jgi:hypothetical protein
MSLIRASLGRCLILAAAFTIVLFAAMPASLADVTINESTKFDGFGAGGFLGSEGSSVQIYAADRSRVESTSKMTGKFMKHFAGGEEGVKSASIFRLDRKVIYSVDYRDKSYMEMPFDFFKQNQQAMADAMKQAQAEAHPDAAQNQEPPPLKCDPIKFEAKSTGEKQTIGGFEASHLVIVGKQDCHNTKTSQTCNMVYTADHWNAPLTGPLKEVRDLQMKQAAAMGIDAEAAQQMAQAARGLLAQNTEGLGEVAKEVAKAGGYPVRSRLTIEKGGDCGTMDTQGGEGSGQDAGAAMKSAFKGLFGKKKGDSSSEGSQQADAKGGSGSAGGLKKIFGMSTEVTSVTSAGAPADAFEPPAGFKKKDLPKIEAPQKK